jgi:hypothetical protein
MTTARVDLARPCGGFCFTLETLPFRQMQTNHEVGAVDWGLKIGSYGSFFGLAWDPRATRQTYGNSASDWPFAMAGLRAYDRALGDEEIAALSAAA